MGLGSFTFRKAKRNDAKIISMREKARERESTAIYLIHKNADENKKRGAFRPLDTQNIRYIN